MNKESIIERTFALHLKYECFNILHFPESEMSYIVILTFLTSHF